jgi:hypothetical protein
MTEDSGLPPLVAEMAQARALLGASHDFYQAILNAVRDSTDEAGEPDFGGLFRRMNKALTGFAPRDHEIKRLLGRLAG